MNQQIDQLGDALQVSLAIFALVVATMIIYVCWLWWRLHQEVRYGLRLPQVARDGVGKRLKERL